MKTKREIEIHSYISDHKEDCLLKDLGTRPFEYHGKVHRHAIYRLPIELLCFNIDNGRLAFEVLEKETELKRKLDPEKPGDADMIEILLLELSQNDTDILEADLKEKGQLEPGLITFDGILINANRRMAVLRRLYRKTQNDKYAYINVAILPKGVNHKDLWKLEANLQFAKEFKQAYAGINELLKLRAGREGGLSNVQIRDALGGRYSEKKLQERFDVLELVDQYLDWLGRPKQYQIIEDDRSLERFNSLQAIVITQLKAQWGKDAKTKIPKLIIFAFELIKAGESHWDIRKLRDIAKTPKALDRILKPTDEKPVPKKSSRAKNAARPAEKKKVPSGDDVQKAFEEAKDIVAAHDEKNRPEKLLTSALTYLRQIDLASFSNTQSELKALVDEIAELVSKLKTSKAKR